MHLSELKAKSPADLLAFAEEVGVENASILRKQDMMFAILKTLAENEQAIIEQLTVLPGSEVTLKLEIDAEVPNGLDRSKVRTLLENANTLGFIDKVIK